MASVTKREPNPLEERLQLYKLIHYPGRSIIFSQWERPDRLYFLYSGLVEFLFIHRDGREKVINVIGPGQFFGEYGSFCHKPFGTTAMAVEPSRVYQIPICEPDRWLREDPVLSRLLLESLAQKIWILGRQLSSRVFQGAEGMVANCLVDWLRRQSPDQPLFPGLVSLTQQELGSLAGLSRVSVSKVLHAFQRIHILEIRRGALHILDPKRLEEIAVS